MNLYKYQAITDYSIDALEKRKWWYSSPSSFNDPFEFKLIIPDAGSINKVKNIDRVREHFAQDIIERGGVSIEDKNTSPEEIVKLVKDHLQKQYSDERLVELLVGRYQNDLYGLGVVSLTENNDDILMWSHYATFHKGICLEFDTDGPDRNVFVKVIYSNDYPGLDFEYFPDIYKLFTTQLVTKSTHWSYEREWRCIRTANGLFPYFGRLSGVIFGARISEQHKEKIKAILKGENINFFQARLHPCEYKLIIEPDK